jgi:hypothetical protein
MCLRRKADVGFNARQCRRSAPAFRLIRPRFGPPREGTSMSLRAGATPVRAPLGFRRSRAGLHESPYADTRGQHNVMEVSVG